MKKKLRKVGNIVYFNDVWTYELGIEIEILKIHKIDIKGQNSIYYYATKRLDGKKPMKRFIRSDCIFDTKEEAIIKGKEAFLKSTREIDRKYFDNFYNNIIKGEN